MDEYENLVKLVNSLSSDAAKTAKGNKSAATRLSVGMLNVKNSAAGIRLVAQRIAKGEEQL